MDCQAAPSQFACNALQTCVDAALIASNHQEIVNIPRATNTIVRINANRLTLVANNLTL